MVAIANSHSKTEEKWIAQVGMERALEGSGCIPGGREDTRVEPRSPRPNRKGEWTEKPREVPPKQKAKKVTARAIAGEEWLSESGGEGL